MLRTINDIEPLQPKARPFLIAAMAVIVSSAITAPGARADDDDNSEEAVERSLYEIQRDIVDTAEKTNVPKPIVDMVSDEVERSRENYLEQRSQRAD